jgi:RHS repeat-associated protein
MPFESPGMTMTRIRMLFLAFLLVLPVFIPPLGQTAGWPTSPPPTQPPSAQSLGECITFSSADNPVDMSKGVVRNLCMQPLAHAWVLNYPPYHTFVYESDPAAMGDLAIQWLYTDYTRYCNPNVPQSGPDGCSWVFGPFADPPYQYTSASVFVTNTPYANPEWVWFSPTFVPFSSQPVCPRQWIWQYSVDASGQNYTTVCIPADSFQWEYAQSASMGNVEGNCVSCNPVDMAMGYKQDDAVDLTNNSPFPIVWQRHYRGIWRRWFFDYDRKLLFPGNIEGQGQRLDRVSVILRREDGQVTPFVGTKSNHVWTWVPNMTNPALNPTILVKFESDEDLTSFTIRNNIDQVETYNGQGQLVSLADARNLPLLFSYDTMGRMTRIDDAAGRFLDLTYPALSGEDTDPDNVSLATSRPGVTEFPETVSDGAHTVGYVFSRNQTDPEKKVVLAQVIKPDGQVITYNHDNLSRLTGITDETGSRYSVYSYLENSDVVASTYHGDHHETATYGPYISFPGAKTFYVDPGGPAYNRMGGMGFPCTYCKGVLQKKQLNYDAAGNPNQRWGFNEKWEERVYDQTRGLPLSITEGENNIGGYDPPPPATGEPPPPPPPNLARTKTIEWDARFRKPTRVTEPVTTGDGAQLRVTLMTYDDHGNLLTRAQAVSGPSAAGQARAEAWTYNSMGEPLTHTDTRQKVTRYTYDPQGNLLSVTNPLGQVTTVGGYDASGNMGWMETPNHLKTRFVRDDLQRVIQVDKGCEPSSGSNCHWETTRMSYAPFGAIASATDPTGKKLVYYYDTAHRNTGVDVLDTDGATLMGKVEIEQTEGSKPSKKTYRDASGTVLQVQRFTYDDLNRPNGMIDNAGGAFVSTMDDEGNLISSQTPYGRKIFKTYDGLNRLVNVALTVPGESFEQRNWGVGDELLSQTDAAGAFTGYTWNGFGDRIGVQSPDAGSQSFTYDTAHNILSRVDGKGQAMTMNYDDLSRMVLQTGQSGETMAFSYDNCTNGLGRLCSVTDRTGVTRFEYDRWGRVTLKQLEAGGHVFALRHTFDEQGNLVSRQTPVRTIRYNWSHGMVSSMDNPATGVFLMADIRHDFLGKILGWTWPDGRAVGYAYDMDGRLLAMTTPALSRNYSRDPDGKIMEITRNDGQNSALYGYGYNGALYGSPDGKPGAYFYYGIGENLNRAVATAFDPDTGMLSFGEYYYGPSSNALTFYSWVYDPSGLGGIPPIYDANGSVLSLEQSLTTLEYDDWNHLRVSHGMMADVTYGVNGLGERVSKTVGSGPGSLVTWFLYDTDGTLVATFDKDGFPLDDYAYLEDTPVNLLRQSTSYAIETDHLGTPVRVMDPTGAVVWSWEDHEAFGNSPPIEGVVNGQTFTFDLRMPGQIFDKETGLFHNGARDYDPVMGRYIEVDPLGLAAGMNPYVYVDGDPVNQVDPTGQSAVVDVVGNNVNITLRIVYIPTTADPAWNAHATKAIESAWTGNFGKYSVKTSVIDSGPLDSPDVNTFRIMDEAGRSNARKSPFSECWDEATVFLKRTDGTSVQDEDFAHEAGHLMGVRDFYDDVPCPTCKAVSKMDSVPWAGLENDMMSGRGGKVSEFDIDNVIMSSTWGRL